MSIYLAHDAAFLLLLSPPSLTHYLSLPLSLKGEQIKYSAGAVSAQYPSIIEMCCGMTAGRAKCVEEANPAGHRAETAAQTAMAVYTV